MRQEEEEWAIARQTPKIQELFWWILGLKHVEICTYWRVGQWSKQNDVFLLPCGIIFNTIFIYRIFLCSNLDVLPIRIDLLV